MRGVIRTIVGLVFGLGAAMALIPALSAFGDAPGSLGGSGAMFWGVVLIGGVLGMFASSIRKAFGRGFLLAGLAVLALPLSVMLLSGRVSHTMASGKEGAEQAGAIIGSGIATMAATGISAVIGLFFGAILIIISLVLLLGGRREVIIIRERGDPA